MNAHYTRMEQRLNDDVDIVFVYGVYVVYV